MLKTIIQLKDLLYRQSKLFYKFNIKKYSKTFLNYTFNEKYKLSKVDKIVYCFWTGDHLMSEDRLECLDSLKNNIGVQVKLISKDNLSDYILPNYPLHKSYEYLSDVHKSDYLRAYFMHHYGGGYSDIKTPKNNWDLVFDEFNNSAYWLVGYAMNKGIDIAVPTFKVDKKDYKQLIYDMRRNFRYIVGPGAFIVKPYTPFTYEWMTQIEKILDKEYDNLRINSGGVRYGLNDNYSFNNNGYTAILAQVFQPLCLKYHNKIKIDKKIELSFLNYR